MKNLIGIIVLLLCFITACNQSGKKEQDRTLDSLNIQVKKSHIQSMEKDKEVRAYMDSLKKVETHLSKVNPDTALKQAVTKAYNQDKEIHQKMNDWMENFHWTDENKKKDARIKYIDSQLTLIKVIDKKMAAHVTFSKEVLKKAQAVLK